MSLNVCRLCLQSDNLGPIFLDKEQSDRYTTILLLTTGLKIKPHDGLPQMICNDCTNLVNSALHLRNLSQNSHKQLVGSENTKDLNSVVGNVIKNDPVDDAFDIGLPDLEIEVEFDRLTEVDDNRETEKVDEPLVVQSKNNESETKDSVDAQKIPKKAVKGMSRKEKKAMYMDLVEGDLRPKGPVKCRVCKKTVSKWSCFISHAKLHLGFKFMCEFCGKSFISSTQLKRHCRSYHGMQRELACKQCSYLALDSAQLLLHVRRVHTGERPYVCDICAASYFSRRCLVQHLESHRTEASVQCEDCEQSFKSNRHLARHRYAAHGSSRRVKCPHCSRLYCRKYLRTHISKHHENDLYLNTQELCLDL